MGACSSKQQKKPNNNNNSTSSLGSVGGANISQQALENQKRHELEHKNNLHQVAINWRNNTIGIWNRTHDKLAIHTDIPRLGHKIDIIDKLDRLNNISFTSVSMGASQSNMSDSPTYVSTNDITIAAKVHSENSNINGNGASSDDLSSQQQQQQQLSNGETSNNNFTDSTTMTAGGSFVTAQVLKKEEVVLQVMLALARLLDGTDKEAQIRNQFHNYIKGAGDMSQQLLQFLEHVVGEESRMMQLLKVCHQKIILPAYYFIKANLFEELPFRDKRGSWRLKITFEEDGTVSAVHSKRQQSTAGSENDPEFEFEWCLTAIYDKEMNITNLKIDVVDLIISKNINESKKQEIQQAFSTLQLATTTSNSSSDCFKLVSNPPPLNKFVES
ncbi:hypothetical protein DFA_01324 [Cavenderia fasciculata]|uniref:Ras guanine nucleotide exchange factor glfB-like C-terminal domain-containing protein n=1 Tax=Cavenderia fasciculata TaxID=261658 RepID=F4PS57_CACFS|nr:uncharacterized protein DFA_01324 [Cavenderia fasciculata]EGG21440.1 hypothetical protein DFA_01324 [Cavenderia fasciculata]|eukprot:XP_004359290.1 hypothetical protein DFA_01324 [Cavenderia fasciculata]